MIKKAITFSYDDGVTQDIRLIELFNKYNMKATFNINSMKLGLENELIREGVRVTHNKINKNDVKSIYEGHEIAAHTLTHPNLTTIEDDNEIIRQVEEDRLNLSEIAGYEVVGMAYPGGGINNDERTAKIIKENTGIKYARATEVLKDFDIDENLYRFKGTCYHHENWNELFTLGEKFLDFNPEKPSVFYIFGHSYEFDIYPERWQIFEEFLKMMSNKNDIFYGTNKDVLLNWKGN